MENIGATCKNAVTKAYTSLAEIVTSLGKGFLITVSLVKSDNLNSVKTEYVKADCKSLTESIEDAGCFDIFISRAIVKSLTKHFSEFENQNPGYHVSIGLMSTQDASLIYLINDTQDEEP